MAHRYLLSALRVKEFTRKTTIDGIYEVLKRPTTVPELLERTLHSIEKEHLVDLEETIRVLQWIAVVQRPLTKIELAEAISLRSCDVSWSSSSGRRPQNFSQILESCGSLISILPMCGGGEAIQFFHPLVLQYLTKECPRDSPFFLSIPTIDQELGRLRLAYYRFPEFDRQLSERKPPPLAVDLRPLDVAYQTVTKGTDIFTRIGLRSSPLRAFRSITKS